MPIQVSEAKPVGKLAPGLALGVLVLIGLVIATRWRALLLVLVVVAAGLGWWLGNG